MKRSQPDTQGNLPSRTTKKELLARVEQLTAALQRERADAANVRQRSAQERLQLAETTRKTLLADLLPLLDNLQRAFAAVPDGLRSENWVKGVLYIDQQLATYLKDLDLRLIETAGKEFDHDLMEAVATVKDPKRPKGSVAEEILRGYYYGDEVLRPAQVKVVSDA